MLQIADVKADDPKGSGPRTVDARLDFSECWESCKL